VCTRLDHSKWTDVVINLAQGTLAGVFQLLQATAGDLFDGELCTKVLDLG
jgi:hypothetical protein